MEHDKNRADDAAPRWRRLRRLASHYDRERFLSSARADLLGREIVALAEIAAECRDEAAYTRVLIAALRRRRRALLRPGAHGETRRGRLADALTVAIFGEVGRLRRQRAARAQLSGLAHLSAQLRAVRSPARPAP